MVVAQDHLATISQLKQQLEGAQQVAGIAMRSSSDLGISMQFIKDSFLISEHEELANRLIETLETLSLDSCVSFESSSGHTIFCKAAKPETVSQYERLIRQHALDGRIVEWENWIQVNYDKASLLVHFEALDEDRVGQLRDTLALLMDAVESRVKSLILAEKAEEARKSKDQFFALMSHELRTPLNPIIGFASRMERHIGKSIDERFGSGIKSIKNSGESLLRLLNHIIDLASIESGTITLNVQRFDVGEAIDRALFKVEALAETKKTQVSKHVDSELMFSGDNARFIDIIISILGYSIKSSTDHRVSIFATRVSAVTESEIFDAPIKTPQLKIRIEDDGTTLSDAYRTRIFSHYLDRNLDTIYESNDLGVGLFLTKKLIELHKGSISLNAMENGGNVFEIIFDDNNSTAD